MAQYDLAPVSAGIAIKQSLNYAINFVTNKLSDGTAVNLGTPFASTFKVFQAGGSGAASPVASLTPTLVCTSGNAQLALTAAQTAAIEPGTYSFVLATKNLTGDELQELASGSITVGPSA